MEKNFKSVGVKVLAPNHVKVDVLAGTYFSSYDSVIAFMSKEGSVLLDINTWNYSRTTTRHLLNFLGVDNKTLKSNVKSGVYKLVNLNDLLI